MYQLRLNTSLLLFQRTNGRSTFPYYYITIYFPLIIMSKSIIIDGIEYVPVNSLQLTKKLNKKDYVIVRTYSAGVFAGYLDKRDGKEVTLLNARRLWYWDGAASLSQLAVDGVSKPENCKFPCEVEKIELLEAIEILSVTQKAFDSISTVKIWKQ